MAPGTTCAMECLPSAWPHWWMTAGGPAREPSQAKTIDSSAVRITGDVTRGGDITGDITWLTRNYMDREIITAAEQRTIRRRPTSCQPISLYRLIGR